MGIQVTGRQCCVREKAKAKENAKENAGITDTNQSQKSTHRQKPSFPGTSAMITPNKMAIKAIDAEQQHLTPFIVAFSSFLLRNEFLRCAVVVVLPVLCK